MFKNAAAEFIFTRTYARWNDELGRRETWPEAVSRLMSFYKEIAGDKVPKSVYKLIEDQITTFGAMPSMRLMWAAGDAARKENITAYNCSFVPVEDIRCFAEILYILMCGTGAGFSCEKRFTDKLPVVPNQTSEGAGIHEVEDSKEGWAKAYLAGLEAWFGGKDIEFDYSKVRPRGARLKTMGGRASGPEPLKRLVDFTRQTLISAQGRKLTDLEVHDIVCEIAEIVVVGGVRRSSLISFSDLESEAMRGAKTWPMPPRRYMANNSAVFEKKPDVITFMKEWTALAASGTGERGLYNISNIQHYSPRRNFQGHDIRSNPCGEILLRPYQFCNLSEIVVRAEDSFDDLIDKVKAAVWVGALQSTMTKFNFIRDDFRKNCEEERLLGVSLTGQMDNPEMMTSEKLKILKEYAIKTAKKAAKALGVNMSVSITTGKPSGCRPWSALTTTNSGILTLEEIMENHKVNEEWSEVSGNLQAIQGGAETRKITKSYNNGLSPIMSVKMTYGLSVESTPNHQWFVKGHKDGKKITEVNKWVRTDEIKVGDILEVVAGTYKNETHSKLRDLDSLAIKMRNDCTQIIQPKEMNEDLAWMLGYLWGDGAMSPGKFRIRFVDQHIFNLEKVQRILLEQFGLPTQLHKASQNRDAMTLDVGSKFLWHWLIKNGFYKYDADKIELIPRSIRESSQADIISFISGLVDSDGWVGTKGDTGHTLTITTADVRFAKHLQDVAWSVGIALGRSENIKGDNFQNNKSMFLLGMSNHTDPQALDILKRNSSKMTLAETSDDFINWKCLGKTGQKFQTGLVKGIEHLGVDNTYDVEVEDNHWYYAGSIKSHNTVSQLVDAASGCHPRYGRFYLRRYRISGTDPLFKMMRDQGFKFNPENGQAEKDYVPKFEGDVWDESKVQTWVTAFPIKSPDVCITRHDLSAIDQLEWYRKIQNNWCEHNQSNTIYVDDHEWLEVGNYVYKHFDEIIGVSFLPKSNSHYEQAPYEDITEEEYNELIKDFPKIDYTQLGKYEMEDNTTGAKSLACSGDKCELN